MLQIEQPQHYRLAIHHLGFRPFFLLGSLFAVIVMGLWAWFYRHGGNAIAIEGLSLTTWHGHEMLYGYGLAIIAGFLLTAVRNWTNVQTLHGVPLLLLAALWLAARLMPYLPHPAAPWLMATFDLGFALWLAIALFIPIYRARQWPQMGVWSKVLLLLTGNLLFYLGLFGVLDEGVRWGLYTGLYLILSLILLMGRRVIPFFIERGVGYPVTLRNFAWLDYSSLVLMLALWLVAVFTALTWLTGLIAAALFLLHALRLWLWYTPGIWRVPLLWVLYLGYGWLVVGFAMLALGSWGIFSSLLATHAFAVGGIGMLTLGMMARVSYGHTGRDLSKAPRLLGPVFALLLAAALVRVALPLLAPGRYADWVLGAQLLWIAAFSLFALRYAGLLVKPRIDGRYG